MVSHVSSFRVIYYPKAHRMLGNCEALSDEVVSAALRKDSQEKGRSNVSHKEVGTLRVRPPGSPHILDLAIERCKEVPHKRCRGDYWKIPVSFWDMSVFDTSIHVPIRVTPIIWIHRKASSQSNVESSVTREWRFEVGRPSPMIDDVQPGHVLSNDEQFNRSPPRG